jgi:hypothetical protein
MPGKMRRKRRSSQSEADWFKRSIEVITLLVIVGGLYFAYDQAERFNDNINLSTWTTMTSQTIKVDKVFIKYPEYLPYFYSGTELKEGDPKFIKGQAISFLMLDYFDSILAFITYMKGNVIEVDAWRHMFDSTISRSPIMCKTLYENWDNYGKEIQGVAQVACVSTSR